MEPDYVPNSAEQLIVLRADLGELLRTYRKLEASAKRRADQAEVEGNVGQLMRHGAREAVYSLVADDIEALLNGE